MRDILKLGIILTLYAVIAGAALAYVNLATLPKVNQNRTLAAAAARDGVLPGMSGGFEAREAAGFEYWVGYRDPAKTEIGGFVFVARQQGYSSVVETMVGVDTEGKIVGTRVVYQQETPGLGTKITEIRHGDSDPWFQRQFIGKSAEDDLRVEKDGGMIDSITGATITSRAVTTSIREGLERLQAARGGAGA